MGARSLLLSMAICILLLSCYTILFLVIRPIFQFAMTLFQQIAVTHFTWLPDSRFLDHCSVPFDHTMALCDVIPGVSLYKKEAEQVECAFCLCDIEEGEEIRELGCRHLFHRCCLDRWLEFGRATCPLCRVALVSVEVEAMVAEVEEEEISDSNVNSMLW